MIQITYHSQTKYLPVKDEKSILELVRESFECSFSPCPGAGHKAGSCSRCTCLIRTQTDAPYPALACSTLAKDGMVVECSFQEGYAHKEVQIVDRAYGFMEEGYDTEEEAETAIDLGSTTIVMKRGRHVYTCLNPQREYGSDVISRIAAASEDETVAKRMQQRTMEAIEAGLTALGQPCGSVVLAGNTTMIHLLMGHDCSVLGAYPFRTPHLASEQLSLPAKQAGDDADLPSFLIRTVPGISAFVGGDIVSGLLLIEKGARSEYDKLPGCYLMVDLGTNGELVLKKNGRFYATSTAAGPAFEGDATANLPGADMIHLIAEALKNNTLQRNGFLKNNAEEQEGETVLDTMQGPIRFARMQGLTQKHVRDIQLAKAAVYTGIKSLLAETGTDPEEIEKVYLAGGFGYFLDPEDAFEIRLLPEEFRGKVEAIGNASLGGAALLASNPSLWETAEEIAQKGIAYLAAENASFADEYIQELNF